MNRITGTSLWLFYVRVFTYTVLALSTSQIVRAAVFDIPSGDIETLIEAIQTANSNGEDNTLILEAGIYALIEAHSTTDGPNGLPSITAL